MSYFWPKGDKLTEIGKIDHKEMQQKAAEYHGTAITEMEVPTYWGDFTLGATAFGTSMLFFPDTEDYEVSERHSYYQLALAGWGKKMAVDAGLDLMGFALGEVKEFSTPVDLSYLSSFQQDVLHTVRKIPFGETITIPELAKMAGHAKKSAPVSNVLKHNPLPIIIPCHRVLPQNKQLGRYCDHPDWKQFLLEHEGNHIHQATA